MKKRRLTSLLLALSSIACSRSPSAHLIYSNHLNSLDAILTRSGVTLDTTIPHRSGGVIRIDSNGPTTIRLAEVRPGDSEPIVLTYRGHLRAKTLKGRAYLEIGGNILGDGEFTSMGLANAVSGTTDWVSQQTRFVVEKGQRVQTVKLNVVVDGAGVVWIGPVALWQTAR